MVIVPIPGKPGPTSWPSEFHRTAVSTNTYIYWGIVRTGTLIYEQVNVKQKKYKRESLLISPIPVRLTPMSETRGSGSSRLGLERRQELSLPERVRKPRR